MTRAAPIAGWSVGRKLDSVLDYFRGRKADVAEITIICDEPAKTGLTIIVCGGRDYANREAVWAALDQLHRRPGGIVRLIDGGANGADAHARAWATARGVKNVTVNAEWDRSGKSAGPIRNRAMLAMKPNGVVAFPGGTGTADMCKASEAAGVPVWYPMRSMKRQA